MYMLLTIPTKKKNTIASCKQIAILVVIQMKDLKLKMELFIHMIVAMKMNAVLHHQ